MITEANIPALMRCVRNNESAPGFNLLTFVSECGTFGCLVGNDRLGCQIHLEETHYSWSVREYGVTRTVWQFLFGECEIARGAGGLVLSRSDDGFLLAFNGSRRRNENDRTAALNRLRKFIYYVLHKRELLYDDNGCIRETARRAEGDHHVLRKVKARLDESAYLASINAAVPSVDFPQSRVS